MSPTLTQVAALRQVAKLQRACLTDPVRVEVASKYKTVDTLRQEYLFIPAKHKVGPCTRLFMCCLCEMARGRRVSIPGKLEGRSLHFLRGGLLLCREVTRKFLCEVVVCCALHVSQNMQPPG